MSVGISADTAQFAVAAIKAWWSNPRPQALPDRQDTDRHRRLRRLQQLPHTAVEDRAAAAGRPYRVEDPGHALPARHEQVEQNRAPAVQLYFYWNWRAKPLVSRQTVIDLIASTTTRAGLKVYARLDPDTYATKIQVTDDQMRTVNIQTAEFHPEWNYTIVPSVIKT